MKFYEDGNSYGDDDDERQRRSLSDHLSHDIFLFIAVNIDPGKQKGDEDVEAEMSFSN